MSHTRKASQHRKPPGRSTADINVERMRQARRMVEIARYSLAEHPEDLALISLDGWREYFDKLRDVLG